MLRQITDDANVVVELTHERECLHTRPVIGGVADLKCRHCAEASLAVREFGLTQRPMTRTRDSRVAEVDAEARGE